MKSGRQVVTRDWKENPPGAEDLVLVAILNTPRDLEIAQTLGWYRIPLVTAPRTVRVDWLAFYLPATFGEHRWTVRYLAEVRGYELRTRRELLFQETDHERVDEPYFKMQLGPVLELSPPIASRSWRRFTFLFTTGDRLLNAVDLTDLTIPQSQIRARLLRERAGSIPSTQIPL
ncbi:MAG: hypothetical protein BMS9Abin28_0625 [Anaerolineae bacterium]|nr:MAG: hypothetical protein BMS9Abin28_0625 [Anaerolineae bacterium]